MTVNKLAMIACLTMVQALTLPVLQAQSDDSLSARLSAAMKAEIRSEAEVARDANRKPQETLAFMGITSDMKVLELIPSRGWYTKLLAPAIDDFHVAIGATWVEENLISESGFDHINIVETENMTLSRGGEFRLNSVSEFSFGEGGFDAVLTFRNMHNFDEAGRRAINKAAFEALSSGGIYGVVDHTRRHMEPISQENRRRADPVEIIKEAQDAGFMLHSYTNLHYKPADDLTLEVGNDKVTGQTDRFTLVFRKP
ncbi:MAG: methyltransferase [Pseudomonadota bacterium]